MSNALQVIDQTLKSKAVIGRLTMSLGYNAGDDKGKQEAFKYAATVLAEVEKTAGDPKRDLTGCNPQSIAQAMVDAAKFRMFIDGRQHAHLVKYGNSATLQIGYRGYIAKIKEHYPDADFTVENIFEGDDLQIWDDNGIQNYKLTKKSAFNDDLTKFKGVLVVISYTNGKGKVQKVSAIPKSEIDKFRKAAKQDFVWNSWYLEKAKAAAIKRACKVHFAAIQGLQDMISYDNQRHFQLEKPEDAPEAKSGGIIENLNRSLVGGDVKDAEIVEDDPAAEPEPSKCRACDGVGTQAWTDGDNNGVEPCEPCGGSGLAAVMQ